MYREINFLDPSNDIKRDKKSLLKLFFLVVFIIALGVGGLKLGLAYNEFTVTSDEQPFWNKITGILSLASEKTDPTPTPDPNRLNILVMGMRG